MDTLMAKASVKLAQVDRRSVLGKLLTAAAGAATLSVALTGKARADHCANEHECYGPCWSCGQDPCGSYPCSPCERPVCTECQVYDCVTGALCGRTIKYWTCSWCC